MLTRRLHSLRWLAAIRLSERERIRIPLLLIAAG
jgi:hypothetical protein